MLSVSFWDSMELWKDSASAQRPRIESAQDRGVYFIFSFGQVLGCSGRSPQRYGGSRRRKRRSPRVSVHAEGC